MTQIPQKLSLPVCTCPEVFWLVVCLSLPLHSFQVDAQPLIHLSKTLKKMVFGIEVWVKTNLVTENDI